MDITVDGGAQLRAILPVIDMANVSALRPPGMLNVQMATREMVVKCNCATATTTTTTTTPPAPPSAALE